MEPSLDHFPEAHRPVLEQYRKALPSTESRALEAWLSTFYPFQLDWVLAQGDTGITNKARQIGISHANGGLGVLWGAFHGELTTIISVGERESLEVLEKAKRHARVLTSLGSTMAEPVRDTTEELSFASGGRILALPSSGGRSFTGNVILDEYAYQAHAAKVWDAAAAVTLLDGRLRVSSTPNGAGNEFHDLWQLALEKDSGWFALELAIDLARAQGYPVDDAKCWKLAKNDPRLYDQLFRCKFLDTVLQYIPSDLFARCFRKSDGGDDGITFGGLDIGETRDRTVLTILRRKKNQRRLVHIESHAYTDDELIQSLVAKAFGPAHKCQRVAVDATGLGKFPAKTLRRKYGQRLEAIDFTLTSKEELATGLYDTLTRDELVIPAEYRFNGRDEIPLLRDDVYAIRRIVTEHGNVRYDAERTKKGHADRAWSLMLANHAAGRMSAMLAALQ